jgi:hypothetical protein
MMAIWSTGWEVEFPAETAHELLVALVVRDLAHGASFDVEAEDSDAEFAIDYTAGEEIEGTSYRLLLRAEIDGHDDAALIQAFTEQALEEMLEEAERLAARATPIGDLPVADLEFRPVAEDDERWDLIIPDWLAPDDAEVPFGFRAYHAATGDPVPDNAALDAHGRIVLYEHGNRYIIVGVPAPTPEDGADAGDPL